jgi:hypothetical protein
MRIWFELLPVFTGFILEVKVKNHLAIFSDSESLWFLD